MDRQMVFYGDLRAVNDALRGMQYICRSVADSCVSGKDSITVQVRDLDQGGDNDLTTKFTMAVAIREPTVDEVQGYASNMGTSGPAVWRWSGGGLIYAYVTWWKMYVMCKKQNQQQKIINHKSTTKKLPGFTVKLKKLKVLHL